LKMVLVLCHTYVYLRHTKTGLGYLFENNQLGKDNIRHIVGLKLNWTWSSRGENFLVTSMDMWCHTSYNNGNKLTGFPIRSPVRTYRWSYQSNFEKLKKSVRLRSTIRPFQNDPGPVRSDQLTGRSPVRVSSVKFSIIVNHHHGRSLLGHSNPGEIKIDTEVVT
jgi:hypothetical protein